MFNKYLYQIFQIVLMGATFLSSAACTASTTSNCGNASLDAGEECDLGTAINNDTEAGSFGCKTNCKKHDGWTCTKDIAEYKVKEQEAATLYASLVTAQAPFTSNSCNLYYAGDTTRETACYGYQENLRKFKELNKVIKVTCGATMTFLERPTTSAQATKPDDYVVNCVEDATPIIFNPSGPPRGGMLDY